MLLLEELPLRGAAGLKERDMLFLGDLPLRGAAGIEKGRCCFWRGSCRCAGELE